MPDAGSIGTYRTLSYARAIPTWADDYRGLVNIPVTGTLSGVVKESGVAVSRWVRLYYRPNGLPVSAVKTGDNGVFSFAYLDPGNTYFVVAFDDLNLAPDRNVQVFDLLVPV
ncbi:hypothetical protein BH20PSE1_BH20PSE1_00980 [soil metagenome]